MRLTCLQSARGQVMAAFKAAEKQKKPKISELFNDVYDTLPASLQEQKKEMLAHIAKYPDVYPTDKHAKEN